MIDCIREFIHDMTAQEIEKGMEFLMVTGQIHQDGVKNGIMIYRGTNI